MIRTQIKWFLFAIGLCSCQSLRLDHQFYSQIREVHQKQISSQNLEWADLCLAGASAACVLNGQIWGGKPQYAIVQGFASLDSTWLGLLVPVKSRFHYLIMNKAENGAFRVHSIHATSDRSYRRDYSSWRMDHVLVSGLNTKLPYELWIIDDRGQLLDRREFSALDLKTERPRVLVASCMDDNYKAEQKLAWASVFQQSPDVMFFIGDNVYADRYLGLAAPVLSPDRLWSRYVDTRNSLDVFFWPKLKPIIAVWDDHDYGMNDGDQTFRYKNEAFDTFFAFFPQPHESTQEWILGPGVAKAWVAFDQLFVFLDGRSQRSPNRLVSPEQTHFGKIQTEWLLDLLQSHSRPAWLINGDQFFGGYHNFESFEGSHPDDFAKFKESLKRIRNPFVFVSGDRHMSEIMKLDKKEVGQGTYELTSSGIHAKTFPGTLNRNPNPRREVGAAGPYNYMIIEPSVKKAKLKLKVRSLGISEGTLFERQLTIPRVKN